ncbi:hypothetical protein CIB48_g11390 [Xylaria polymorpha]|nr:hypothetical protein CIB48_g11390 [Xylaria polymorpha]
MLGRTLFAWSAIGLASLVNVAFATDLSDVDLATVPQCGLLCIVNTVTPKSNCSITDFPCICANAPLNDAIEACFATECTPREALRKMTAWVVPLVFVILSTILYLTRLLSRVVLHQGVGLADIILGGATFPVLWAALTLAEYGLGQDIWEIPQDNITKILYSSNAIRFTGPEPFGTEHSRATVTTSTSSRGSFGYHLATSTFGGIVRLKTKESSDHDYVQFWVHTLVVFANSTNISYDYVDPGLYSVIEASISIIVCCLPAVRALLSTVAPTVFAATKNASAFSSGKTPKTESSHQRSHQRFNRLDDAFSSADDTRGPIRVQQEWQVHRCKKSDSNVELMPMKLRGTETHVETECRVEAAREDRNSNPRILNWSRPLPHERENGLH